MLMGLRGTPFLYYGDEIGMPDTDVPHDRVLDPVGVFHGAAHGPRPRAHADAVDRRSRARASRRPASSRGFRTATSRSCNVADQRHDPDSMLSLTRDLIGLRDALPELRRGAYATLPSSDDRLWAWLRGERTVVAMNCSDDARRRSRRRAPARSASRRSAPATANGSPDRCTSRRGKPRSSGATLA